MGYRLVRVIKTNYWTWYRAQTLSAGGLGGRCEEDLHADTYAKIWFPGVQVLLKGLKQTMIVQGLDGSVEGTLAGKYESLGGAMEPSGVEMG